MRRKDFERARARELRLSGASLRDIAYELQVSLSSASLWVRDLPREVGEAKVAREPQPRQLELEPTIRCGRCRQVLPESAFSRHPDGRQYWCRECYRGYFRTRGDLHRRQSAAAKRKRQRLAREFVQGYLASHPCVDCGELDPLVLEFDHVSPKKKGHVSWLARDGASVRLLTKEIDQCEVVCVNCHRRRTGSRAGWRRSAPKWWRTSPPKRYETARNLAYVYSILERTECTDCGVTEMVCLDFDHIGPKTGGVLALAREGVGLARLEHEIGNCEIRCGNCHRRRTKGRQAVRTRS